MSITIRAVKASDREVWQPLWQGYQRFYMTEISAQATDRNWQRFLDPDEQMFAAIAWRGSMAVGLVHWVFHRSTWTEGDYCYLQDLFVAKGERSGGVGRQLMQHVYQQAQEAGCSRVHWLTHESNTQAMLLYDRIGERSGFVQYRKVF